MGIHISLSLRPPSVVAVAKALGSLLGRGVMQVKRDWDEGLPIVSIELGNDEFHRTSDAFKKALGIAESYRIEPRIHWTDADPADDPDCLHGAEISIEYAINTIDERLVEMKISGF